MSLLLPEEQHVKPLSWEMTGFVPSSRGFRHLGEESCPTQSLSQYYNRKTAPDLLYGKG